MSNDMLYVLSGIFAVLIIGLVISDIAKKILDNTKLKEKERIIVNGNYLKPMYYGYIDGYAAITRCERCDLIALRADQTPVNPCNRCGGKVVEAGSAKWTGLKWERFSEQG